MKPLNTYLKIAKLGAVSGMRSMVAVALLRDHLVNIDSKALNDKPLSLLKTSAAGNLLKMAAAGEMLADKMPFTPSRILAPSLVWRVLWGALMGAGLTFDKRRSKSVSAAVVGGGAALITTYLAWYLRVQGEKRLHIPSAVLGAVEDAAVLALKENVVREME